MNTKLARVAYRKYILTYNELMHYKVTNGGVSYKITSDVEGPGTLSYGASVNISESYSVGISPSSSIKSVIQSGASFSWIHSTSSNSVFGITYSVPSGKIGYVKFTPYFNETRGDLTEKSYQAGTLVDTKVYTADGTSPIELSTGFADGLYQLILR